MCAILQKHAAVKHKILEKSRICRISKGEGEQVVINLYFLEKEINKEILGKTETMKGK